MMKNWRVLGACGAVVALSVAVSCSTERDYVRGSNQAAGSTGEGGDASTAGGATEASGGNAQAGSSGSGTESGAGGTSGAAGGGEAGGAGTGSTPEACPAFSCCISGKAFDANEASPLNPCELCKPASSTDEWTAADGQACGSGQGFRLSPKAAVAKSESCSSYCVTTVPALTAIAELSLKLTGSGQSLTSWEKFVELDFSNIVPSEGLSVSNATLELHAEPNAPTAEQRYVTVRRLDDAAQLCKLLMPTGIGVVKLTCDVTTAVKSWIASPAEAKRTLKISYSGQGDRTIDLRTPLAADGTQRPVLLLDYASKCQGNTCPPLSE